MPIRVIKIGRLRTSTARVQCTVHRRTYSYYSLSVPLARLITRTPSGNIVGNDLVDPVLPRPIRNRDRAVI